ncbi:MAG: DRTGG domain-containing protein [Erysipelotrichaceae bacterium]
MNIEAFQQQTGCEVYSKGSAREVSGVYISDLLSWVMGHAQEGQAWATVQAHENVIAIAKLKELACIILVEGASMQEEVIRKAQEEEVWVFATLDSAYEVAKKLATSL